MGDDIGVHNISAYNLGIMGYRTPNIDRIAKEGMIFTHSYGQQICTAGRASFILGQNPFRTGLLTVGMPGSPQGIPDWSPTIADLLMAQGYTTGQFGKNHLGDLDKHLPTKHGFDEFFGNLYHLNAEEEPEGYYYPKNPSSKRNTARAECSTVPRMGRSKTPVRSRQSGWRPSTRRFTTTRWTSSSAA
jgi:arylsulfatase